MTRRRFAGLAGIVTVVAVVRVLAPGQFETAVDRAGEIVTRAPEPVVLGVSVVLGTVCILGLLVYIARFYYWAWRQVEGPVTRFWNALRPESPVVRFGLGLTVMVFVFLIGPLVVLQTFDVSGEDSDPVDRTRENSSDDNTTGGTDTGDNGTGDQGDDDPEDPSEPPGGEGR